MAAIAAAHRRAFDGAIGPEIVAGDEAAGGADAGDQPVRHLAAVEAGRAVRRDRPQRNGEIGLDQPIALPQRGAVGAREDFCRGRPARQPLVPARQRVGEIVAHRDAVAGQRDGRLQQLCQRELSGAVFRQRQRQPGDRAGHADAERGVARSRRVRLAVGAEEHVAGCGLRRGLAIVDGDILVAVGEVDHHEAAAAEIAGARIGHRHGKAGGDRGIHRVAAARQHVAADPCRKLLLRHHHAVRGDDRRETIRGRQRHAAPRILRRRAAREQRDAEPGGEGPPRQRYSHRNPVSGNCHGWLRRRVMDRPPGSRVHGLFMLYRCRARIL